MRYSVTLVALALAVAISSCSSSAKDTVNELSARAAAEAMRVAVKSEDVPTGRSVRDMAILRKAADKLPGSVKISGLQDGNADGKDDDGKVELTVGRRHACLTARDTGHIDVTDGAC